MSSAQTSHVEAIEPELEQPEKQRILSSLSGPAAWWVVSTLLHVLIIALATLIGACYAFSPPSDDVVVTTVISPPPQLNVPVERRKTELGAIVAPPIEIPDEVLARAERGHFETIDPDRLDTGKAFGNEDAHMFPREHGLDDAAGGGGLGGTGLNDQIGVGGVGSTGEDGGWGGGKGGGFGNDVGKGQGNFGWRNGGGRHFGTGAAACRVTEGNVELGLTWLAYHQEADGHWDTVKHGASQKTDTAMTGLALLAFAGAGHSERVGRYRDNVKRAVAWLKSKQQANGLIFDATDAGSQRGIGYPHAIATLGLVEAAGMGNVKETRAAAQRAVDYATELHQQGEGSDKLGWRYSATQAGDLSVTGWYVMAMKSAKIAGLHVNPAAFEGAIKFIESVEIKDGADAYGATHFAYQPGSEHPGSAHRLTAIGALVRQFCGWKKEETQGSVDWFVNKGGVPAWGANGESVDLYYWYYGSMCAFQQGGDVWNRWNHAMIKALTENQCKTGDDAGSWPVMGEFSGEWGRVGQTALSALCLEVYYRYEKLKN